MPKWVKRLREIEARNPDALPKWLRRHSGERAWSRISWLTEGGTSPEAAARPVMMMFEWLARRGLLTRQGTAALKVAQTGSPASLALTASMVEPKAAAFLDAYWEKWWQSHGINLTISAACGESALAAIDEGWAEFGKARQDLA